MIRVDDLKTMSRDNALAYIAGTDDQTVSSRVAAYLTGADPYALVISAKNGHLTWLPHFFSGNRLKISKAGLLAFCGWREAERPTSAEDTCPAGAYHRTADSRAMAI